MTDPRDRPPGLAPKGTSAGFGIMLLYWITAPAFTLMALSPIGQDVLTLLLPSMLTPLISLPVMVVTVIGFKSRRYWGVVAYFWMGVSAIMLLATGFVAVIAMLVYSAFVTVPLIVLTYTGGGLMLVLAAFLPLLLRALRLRYWQPGAPRETWETGDERINPRVVRALGGRR